MQRKCKHRDQTYHFWRKSERLEASPKRTHPKKRSGKLHGFLVGFQKGCAIGTLSQVLFENRENEGL